jgi:hypothetical protein
MRRVKDLEKGEMNISSCFRTDFVTCKFIGYLQVTN